ncbi:hypothetical protein C2G38_2189955 [Gigaspora rosea]|uniref:BTB domain-containing protein n=1 Tax=Gigaspora rosea TaxID=44941 RepID=A0A397V1Q5_9GLOM|nr:hypothetical protein C2G38_2189955 [Gigaspora rosea]
MVLKFFEKLSNSYIELNDEEDFNIIIDVGYLYFCNELANINSDENHVKTVNLKYVSTQQFEIIINYLELLNDEEDFNIITNVTNINSDENNIKTINLKHVSTQQFEIIINIKFFEKLSNSYFELLNDEEDFNIIINVGESPNTKIF